MKNSEMYKFHNLKPIVLSGLIGVVLGIHQSFAIDKEVGSDNANARINNQGAGVGLDTGIADFLTKSLAEREQKSYLNRAYEANFPTDPFGAVMEEVQGKKNDLVLGGIEEIATQLKIHNCSLSQKNISAILYYFNDNFRGNMEYQLLKNSSQTVEIRYTPGAVESACKKFNQCYYTAFKGDVMTDCKEKFTHRYSEGVNRKQNLQTIQTVQVGEDKYRNTSLEDSPYDLMYDISAISKILFESIQDPHQLAFYHLPNRKGNNKNGVGNTNEGSSEGTGNNDGKTPSENGTTGESGTGNNETPTEEQPGGNGESTEITPSELPGIIPDEDSEFNDFLERLGENGFSNTAQTTLFGGQMCIGTLDQIDDTTENTTSSTTATLSPDADDVDPDEYQDYIETLIDEIDSYLDPATGNSLPTGNVAGDPGDTKFDDENDVTKALGKIKACFNTCEGLAYDKMLACKAICICDQRDSSSIGLFDPYKTPGLGPILIVKVCTVPASSRNFEAKGIVAKSIEEIFGQLAGVVDTLDKSGELGTRTPEKEMLDNPAGNINFGKSIAFTFDQMVQKTVKELKPSAQYTQQLKKSEHNTLQETLGILHPLENPVSTNAYVIIQNPTTMNIGNIVTAQVNYDDTLTKIEALAQTPQLLEAPKNTAERERIINLQIIMQLFLQQHLEFWINTTDTIREFSKSASCLNEKRNPTTTSCN